MIEYFVLKHLPTGEYQPESGGGYTRWNPGDLHHWMPRLFPSAGSARKARAAWLAGVWCAPIQTETDGWEGPSYKYQDTPYPDALPEGYAERKPEDVVVLRWQVTECPA